VWSTVSGAHYSGEWCPETAHTGSSFGLTRCFVVGTAVSVSADSGTAHMLRRRPQHLGIRNHWAWKTDSAAVVVATARCASLSSFTHLWWVHLPGVGLGWIELCLYLLGFAEESVQWRTVD
jgi:hypothetical protein